MNWKVQQKHNEDVRIKLYDIDEEMKGLKKEKAKLETKIENMTLKINMKITGIREEIAVFESEREF